MIKVVFLVRRHPDMSPEEFHAYWRETHAPLVARHAATGGLVRYVQSHHQEHPFGAALREARAMTPEPFDGIAELYFESVESAAGGVSTPEGQAMIAELLADEARFIDLANSTIFLVEDVEIPL